MAILIQLLAAYVAVVTAGIILESPRRIVFRTGIIGSISYAVYLFLSHTFHTSDAMGYFVACLVASIIAQIFARRYKSAVILFYVPTFYLYVPGSAIYQMAYHFIAGEASIAASYLIETLMISGAIALGIFIADSFIAIYLGFKQKTITTIKSTTKKIRK